MRLSGFVYKQVYYIDYWGEIQKSDFMWGEAFKWEKTVFLGKNKYKINVNVEAWQFSKVSTLILFITQISKIKSFLYIHLCFGKLVIYHRYFKRKKHFVALVTTLQKIYITDITERRVR